MNTEITQTKQFICNAHKLCCTAELCFVVISKVYLSILLKLYHNSIQSHLSEIFRNVIKINIKHLCCFTLKPINGKIAWFDDILIENETFPCTNMHWELSSAKQQPFGSYLHLLMYLHIKTSPCLLNMNKSHHLRSGINQWPWNARKTGEIGSLYSAVLS